MQTFLDDTVGEATSPTLSSHAYRAIRAALMSGYFRPGERLTMRGLADEMQMSVTPVREAIQQLITERALFMPGARTVVVPRISRAEYDEIVLIRLALEGLAARFAIEVIGAADLVELRRINALHRESIESGNTVAALNSSGYSGIVDPEKLTSERLPELRVAASHIAHQLTRYPTLSSVLRR